jgi:hypothetical protein
MEIMKDYRMVTGLETPLTMDLNLAMLMDWHWDFRWKRGTTMDYR